MEDFLKTLMGKRIDVSCAASVAFRGDVIDVKSGILFLRDDDELFHRIIGALNNARTQKKSFDVVAFVKINRQPDDFFGFETRPPDI